MRFGIRASNFSRAGCALVAAVAALSSHAWADGGERGFLFQFAPTSFHYHDSPDYKGNPWLVGVEYSRNDDWLVGYSYFNNSFDQKSHYAYGGRSWKIGTSESPSSYWYLKATGGVIVGYRDPYEDKIPFNHNGIAPGIVFGVGYRYGAFNAQVNVLGTSGLMVTFGYALPQ